MELVFIRHGFSEWNAKNLFTGWRDAVSYTHLAFLILSFPIISKVFSQKNILNLQQVCKVRSILMLFLHRSWAVSYTHLNHSTNHTNHYRQ